MLQMQQLQKLLRSHLMITANANRTFDGPTQASTENKIFVADIAIPAIIRCFKNTRSHCNSSLQ